MANEKKSIIEEALLEAEKIDATFKSNAKEILAQTMSSEIEEMVKESLTGSKQRLKEEDEEEMELTSDVDTDEEDIELSDESDEDEEDMDMDLSDESDEDIDMEMDLEDESDDDEDMELDLDLGDETEGEEMMEPEMVDTVDLTDSSDADVISVFKKMGPEDEIEVVNDNGMVTLKDKKSGSEYRIELNSQTGEVGDVEMSTMEEGLEDSNQVIYEVVIEDDYMDEDYMDEDYMDEDYMDNKDEMSMPMYMKRKKEMSYEKSGLKHPEKADLNDNKRISSYEKTRGMAIEKSMEDNEDEMSSYMKSYMKHGDEDHMGGMKSYMKKKHEEDYASRTKSTKGRYYTGNRTNPNAIARMGSSEYMGESKSPQISKLINENTNLNESVSTLRKENEELKGNQEKMVDALKQFRNKLQEVAVFNSNLTYAVRLFTEQSTTKEEKQEILKRLDEAKSLKESQSIYKQLVKELSNSKTPIKESVEEKLNKTASSGSVQISEQTVFVHPELQNMKKLWEYGYKK